MNKYLEDFNLLDKNHNGNGYETLIKMLLAVELNAVCESTDEQTLKSLPTEQEELIIDISYEFYDGDLSPYQCVCAVIKTLTKNFNGDFRLFKTNYEKEYCGFIDLVAYNII